MKHQPGDSWNFPAAADQSFPTAAGSWPRLTHCCAAVTALQTQTQNGDSIFVAANRSACGDRLLVMTRAPAAIVWKGR